MFQLYCNYDEVASTYNVDSAVRYCQLRVIFNSLAEYLAQLASLKFNT